MKTKSWFVVLNCKQEMMKSIQASLEFEEGQGEAKRQVEANDLGHFSGKNWEERRRRASISLRENTKGMMKNLPVSPKFRNEKDDVKRQMEVHDPDHFSAKNGEERRKSTTSSVRGAIKGMTKKYTPFSGTQKCAA